MMIQLLTLTSMSNEGNTVFDLHYEVLWRLEHLRPRTARLLMSHSTNRIVQVAREQSKVLGLRDSGTSEFLIIHSHVARLNAPRS